MKINKVLTGAVFLVSLHLAGCDGGSDSQETPYPIVISSQTPRTMEYSDRIGYLLSVNSREGDEEVYTFDGRVARYSSDYLGSDEQIFVPKSDRGLAAPIPELGYYRSQDFATGVIREHFPGLYCLADTSEMDSGLILVPEALDVGFSLSSRLEFPCSLTIAEGEYSLEVSDLEVISVPLGLIETYVINTKIEFVPDKATSRVPWLIRYTLWYHPDIGIVKSKRDLTYFRPNSDIVFTIEREIISTNYYQIN